MTSASALYADGSASADAREHSFYGNGGTWYALPQRGIVPGSEAVRIGTRPLLRGTDYYLDYTTGTLVFTEPVKPIQRVRVSYKVNTGQSASDDSLGVGVALQFLPGLKGYYAAVSPNRFADAKAASARGAQLLGVTYTRAFAPQKPIQAPENGQDGAGGQPQQGQAAQAGGIRAMWFASSSSASVVDRIQDARDPVTNLWAQLGPGQKQREPRPSGSLLSIGFQGLSFLGGKLDAGYEDVGRGVNFDLVNRQFAGSPDQALVQG
ncbi:MAG: hypothetical protein ACUVTZ_05110, partial [Armatimonadota bacterium]